MRYSADAGGESRPRGSGHGRRSRGRCRRRWPCWRGGGYAGGPGAPLALTVDDLAAPGGIGLTDVYFGWHVDDGRRGARSRACTASWSPRSRRPAARRGTGGLGQRQGPVRGTGVRAVWGSASLRRTPPTGWTVQTWDGSGVSGPLARAVTFDTGLDDGALRARGLDQSDRPSRSWTRQRRSTSTNTTGVWAYKDEYSYVRKDAEPRRLSDRQGPSVRIS